jgi:hypothetical protein
MRRNPMKEKTIVIEIDEQGNCSMDLEGFHGKGCSDVAKDFQGSDVVKNVRNKPEFYIQQAAESRRRQQS